MEKLHNFWGWFNRPAQVFYAIGYIAVAVGVFISVAGPITALIVDNEPSFKLINPIYFLVVGTFVAVVVPQIFFAISKVVKAAEKYLEEK